MVVAHDRVRREVVVVVVVVGTVVAAKWRVEEAPFQEMVIEEENLVVAVARIRRAAAVAPKEDPLDPLEEEGPRNPPVPSCPILYTTRVRHRPRAHSPP